MFSNLRTTEPNHDFSYERFWRDVGSAHELLRLQIDVSSRQHDEDPDSVEQILLDTDERIDRSIRRVSAYQPVTAPELLALFTCICARTAAGSEPDAMLAKAVTAGVLDWLDAAEPDDPRVEVLGGLLDLVAIETRLQTEPQPAPVPGP